MVKYDEKIIADNKIQIKEFFFSGNDGKNIAATSYEVENPIAALQIVHGMAEHRKRYKKFAYYLNNYGFNVYINDHRGHGETAGKLSEAGYFADEKGWDLVLEDVESVSDYIHHHYEKLPIFILGHSMGSFIVRGLLTRTKVQFKGVILSGTAGEGVLTRTFALWLAKQQVRRFGKKVKSPLLDKLMFGSFSKKFKNNQTNFDWLSSDEQQVKLYVEDPWCGFVCTNSFYLDLLEGLSLAMDTKKMATISKDLPFLFIAGERDPVGKNGKGVLKSAKLYQKAGIKSVDLKLYENGRHEILNEIFKKEVYQDVIDWIKNNLSG